MKRIGIMGGTFNPPHIAHAIVAESVRQQLELNKILFIPSGNPPLKDSIPAAHRLAMTRIAFEDDANFEVSEIEMKDSEKSFTVNTLERLHQNYKKLSADFYLIIGVDNLIELPKWKDPERLFELSNVMVINRPGFSEEDSKTEFKEKVKFINVPHLEISSSMIRDFVRKGKSVRYLVNERVLEYITTNKLYL